MTTDPIPAKVQRSLAADLRTAHQQRKPIPPVRGQLNDIAAGYAVQEINTEHWLGEGRRLAGRKIGLTSLAVQRQLGVDQPDYGALYADMAYADGESFSRRKLIQPKVEA